MWYEHERREKTTRYTGPRPSLPKEKHSLASKMKRYLEARGLSHPVAVSNGWYPSHCHGADRIVIPCHTSQDETYYQARAMDDNPLRYASPKASREDAVVTCYPLMETGRRKLVVVEGPMDALAAATCGHYGIGIMGNTPPLSVLRRIRNTAKVLGYDRVHVVPDMDMIELGATMAGYLGQYGIKTVVLEPQDKDLAAMSIPERKEFLRG